LLAASLGRIGEASEQVVLLGGSALARQAEAVGIRGAMSVGVPFGRALAGWPAVASHLRRLGLGGAGAPGGAFDLIHCWSVGALSLATLMFRATPRLLSV